MASGLRPHVVLVVADDMGYSDLGCYGGEVATPTLDRLGRAGVRLSRFYNTARCSPSRASLLTGLHPHQTGLGILTNDDRPQGYPGSLNRSVRDAGRDAAAGGVCDVPQRQVASRVGGVDAVRRVADAAGLRSLLRHAVGVRQLLSPDHADAHGGQRRARGGGARVSSTPTPSRDEAEAFVRAQGSREPGRPFFLYTAYTAPHWPLHAPAGRHRAVSRRVRRGLGRAARSAAETAGGRGDHAGRDDAERPRSDPAARGGMRRDPAWQLARMQAYAAQIDRMDRGIGRIVDGAGGDRGARRTRSSSSCPTTARAPRPCRSAISRASAAGAASCRPRPGPARRCASATRRTSSRAPRTPTPAMGGRGPTSRTRRSASTSAGSTRAGSRRRSSCTGRPAASGRGSSTTPFQLTDVVPTVLEATGAAYPASYAGRDPLPLEGRSMLPALRGGRVEPGTLYWEHIGNTAIRRGRWKLVREHGQPWELYDIDTDRAELANVAASHSRRGRRAGGGVAGVGEPRRRDPVGARAGDLSTRRQGRSRRLTWVRAVAT